MIYAKSPKKFFTKVDEVFSCHELMIFVFNYVGNVSSCLAVSPCFVPFNYVTTLKAFKRGRKKINALLSRRTSITTIEFVGCDLCFNRLGEILTLHTNINNVILTRCSAWFDYISSQSTYQFDEDTWTYTIRSKQRTVHILYMDDVSREYILDNCTNIHPTTALERLLCGMSSCRLFNIGLSYAMVYVNGDHDYLMKYKHIFRRLFYRCLDVADYRTYGEEERKAAIRVVLPSYTTFVALFEKPLRIWKFVSIYKHHHMNDDWTWEDAQPVGDVVDAV